VLKRHFKLPGGSIITAFGYRPKKTLWDVGVYHKIEVESDTALQPYHAGN